MKVYITRPPAYASSPDHVVRVLVDGPNQRVGVEMCIVFSPNPSEPVPDDGTVVQSGDKFYKVIAASEFDYELLKRSTGWADRQAWHLTFRWDVRSFTDPIPLYTYSMATKMSAPELSRTTYQNNLSVGFVVPFSDSAFEDCAVTVNINPDVNKGDCVVMGVNASEIERTDYSASAQVRELILLPGVQISAPTSCTPDGQVNVQVQVLDANDMPIEHDAEIFLEAVNGYLPKTRIKTVNGQASVPFMALGLVAGDSARVKAGFKYFSGASDVSIQIHD
jgi:hypothetical protein